MADDDYTAPPQPEKLLTLLSLGPGESLWQPDELGAILTHQLDAPLRETLAVAADEVTPWGTLRELFLNPSVPVVWLERVKRVTKDASADEESGVPREVSTVLYIGSIVLARRAGH